MPPRRTPVPKPTFMDMIYQFNKLKPPKFQGGAYPLKYEEWFRKLENLFENIECPGRFKIALTTNQIEGDAKYWWGLQLNPREKRTQ